MCQLTQAVNMSSAGTYYEVLGIKHDASTTEIMNAYNNKVQKVHSLDLDVVTITSENHICYSC